MLSHHDITSLSGFHTPATAKYFVEYTGENIANIQEAAKFANENTLPILVIGGGRNMLFAFEEYPGLVIYNNSRGYTIIQKEPPSGRGVPRYEAGGFCNKELGGDLLKYKSSNSWNFTEIPYRDDLTEKAKELRKNMTGPEKKIWYTALKKDGLKGFRFLRQKPLLDYIVDFYCHELGLVIELDGFSHHENKEYDEKRTQELEKYGLTVIRFSNDEVLMNFDSVCDKLAALIKNKSSPLRQTKGTSFKKEVAQIPLLEGGFVQDKSSVPTCLLTRSEIHSLLPFKKEVVFHVASGHPIWELAEVLENKHAIPYWHRFLGLPGSIGGSVFGNAGCFGLEIGPYVKRVEILDLQTGDILTKTGAEMNFGYRWSECKNHPEWFLLSIDINLSQKLEKYHSDEEPLAWRERMQPEGLSCGSFFKNPSREQSAGSLIEQVGLKGYHHGGAYFSDKHANFLMSDGTATSTQLVELVELAQQKVFEQFGIQLEPEVRIIRV